MMEQFKARVDIRDPYSESISVRREDGKTEDGSENDKKKTKNIKIQIELSDIIFFISF